MADTAYDRLFKAAQDARDQGYAVIIWTPDDAQTLHPEWTDEDAELALQKVARQLEDRSVEYGWDVLRILLDE